jgi:hypothetical protein
VRERGFKILAHEDLVKPKPNFVQISAKSHGLGQSRAKASQSHGFGFGWASDF